ncbi:DUF3558 domain-containing protein [Streptomyces sp. SID335]|uniref:DUF3558 domain-containing protein n=1 Tax=Streptomyces venezuelae TaxID=54571 RepID=A0A5P2BME1_STRVZ|nr:MULTISPECIES: DUF3558 domain-containing protein [unclassified Streptomyces]NDZ98328.1 DUF3558 domain-containing protein [Streptomyces sp. SID10116]QES31656.1 hypothetical protein DEJ47_21570 [Streptomyces venezuelae]MYY85865.1 DUF3558 domain-containing protein [Streptomyces sp. SID335]MYZ16666.1 DUF3558 domain-containing protein [Streptomyces sp. SID337]NDZ90092.1 DUF3558 domain-containing protein [Streptomyces sp. SID10115]
MKAKACVPGVAALLAVVLTGCSGGSGSDDGSDDSKPGDSGSANAPAQPGKYRTLPEPCGEVDEDTLDSMLPGIPEMTDPEQREKAYEGTPTVTYDTDRRVGCNWKIESTGASHHLLIDFERVVSYDGSVSDDARAAEVYATKLREAGLSRPSDAPTEGTESPKSTESTKGGASESPDKDDKDDKGEGEKAGAKPQGGKNARFLDGTASSEPATPPPGLEPRTLSDLGDEAFLDDVLTTATSASRHRTVTVVFRTSNVIVTIEYDEQPGRRTDVPDSKEMQDKAQDLADSLAGEFDE